MMACPPATVCRENGSREKHLPFAALNQAMLDQAAVVGTTRSLEWRQADAMPLPFPNGSFDAVACQFGVMFFSEKSKVFAKVRRVLRPSDIYLL